MIKNVNDLKKKNNKKGFTLIELIVVIAILGILAAIAIPRLTGFQETAREKAHVANVATLTSAGTLFVAENGNPAAAATATAVSATAKSLGSYVETWPTNPWGSATGYTLSVDTGGVVIVTGGTK